MNPKRSEISRRRSAGRPNGSDEATRLGTAAVVLLTALPMFATLIYGATEIWAFVPLSLSVAILLILWIADGLKKGRIEFAWDGLQLPFAGLIAIGLLQMLPLGSSADAVTSLSLDPYATRFFTIRLIILFGYFGLCLTLLRSAEVMRRIAVVFVFFGAIVAFAGILQRLMSPDAIYGMRPTPQAIPFGPFVNQHHFAAFMEMMSGLTLGLLFGDVTKQERKPLLLIALLVMLIGAVLTGSRGGMISLAAGAVFFFIVRFVVMDSRRHNAGEGSRWHLKAGAVGFTALIVIGSVLFLAGADPLMRGIGAGSGVGDPTSGRTHFWAVAWQIFLAHPVIGAGFDAFGTAFTRYDSWNGLFRVEQAHNDYLQTLADGGLLAFACVAAFVAIFIKKSLWTVRHVKRPSRRGLALGAMSGCVGIMVHSFFDFPMRTPSNAIFFLVLVVFAVSPATGEHDVRK